MALAIEVVRPDTGERETFNCASSPVRVGRSPLNNVVLAAPWVSLHHGLIHFDDQQASYSDLGSTNGTSVVVDMRAFRQEIGQGRASSSSPAPVYPAGVTRYAAPGESPEPPRATGPALPADAPRATSGSASGVPQAVYQAGMTRMVMPDDQA